MTRGLPPSPCRFDDDALDDWTEVGSPVLALARMWSRYAPRGKGFVPRLLGRTFRRQLKGFMRTKRGACLAIEPTSLDVYAYMLTHGRVWDEHVFDVCSSLVSAESVFYDIGANVGYMAIEMATMHRDRVTVVAFEPQPRLARAVVRSGRLNGLTRLLVFDVLLGERDGESELFLTSHSLHASMVARERRATRLPRRLATVDGMVSAGSVPAPDVMKLDVEGAEFGVLSGARHTIATNRPGIVFEANDNMKRFGHTLRDLVDLVGSLAPYDFFVLVRGKPGLVPIAAWDGLDSDIDIAALPSDFSR